DMGQAGDSRRLNRRMCLATVRRLAALWLVIAGVQGWGRLYAQDSEADQNIRSLIAGFRSDSQRIREASVFRLIAIGDPAVPLLIQAINDPVPQLRVYSIGTLRQMRPLPKSAIPAITKALSDRRVDVRVAAAEGLRLFGPDARGAVPALRESLHSLRSGGNFN